MDKTLLLSGGHTTRPLWGPLGQKYRLAFIDPGAAQLAAEMHVPEVAAVGQYANPDVIEAVNNQAVLLSAKLVNAMPQISERFAATYGENRPHELNGHLHNWLPGLAHHLMRPQVELLLLLEQTFANQSVAGLIVHEDVTATTRTAIEFCKRRGVPTIHVPHAACHLLPETTDIHKETRADYVISSGVYESLWFGANGMAAERVFDAGNISLDWFYGAELPSREEARRVLLLEKPAILYCASWTQTTSLRSGFEKEIEECLLAVIELARKWDSILMVSLHPNDNPQMVNYYAQHLDRANVPGIVAQNHFNYLLRAAEVMIAQGPSNACQVSALLGTPNCYFQTEGFDYYHKLPYRGLPGDLETFATRARDSRDDPQWQEFLAYYNSKHPNGGAVENAVKIIEQLCPLP